EILSTLLTRPDLNLNTLPLLHTAVIANSPAVVALLLQRTDLDINLASPITPLELAVAHGEQGHELVRLLCERKDLDVNKNNVVHMAIRRGWEGIVRLLVEREDLDVN
ncbi:hypothetical protein BZA05DRAFT_313559, partial [Tricharina praecox]|uniref:uncharacterized protein n=1 Tax=Tricharina praecox TaxID=43433 RepID=UPI00221F2923